METRVSKFPSVLGIFLLFACFFSRTEAAFDPESFQQKLVALQKILDYINNRPNQMNIDATFGVTLSEANLVAALLHENVQYLEDKFFIALKEVVVLSDLTRRTLMKTLAFKNEIKSLVQSTINNPNLWIKPISWTKILPKSKLSPNESLSYWDTMLSVYHGTPNGIESDYCLVEIMRSHLNGECQIPETCIATLIREDDTTGYPLTHRLIIVQLAKALRCKEVETLSLSSLIPTYCARIFQDFINLEKWDFPNIGKDLMMEQIAFCGMEGYCEFVDKHYEDLILSWPHWSGCFGIGFFNKHKIIRRSSTITDFGCESHTTGFAAASLAVFIRENIESGLSQP